MAKVQHIGKKDKKMMPLVDGVKLKINTIKTNKRKKRHKEPKIVN